MNWERVGEKSGIIIYKLLENGVLVLMTCIICGIAPEEKYLCSIGEMTVCLCGDHIDGLPVNIEIEAA